MPATASDIENALDDLISHEEGKRFQRLAVVLAKQRWRGLVACEGKKDLGLDAYLSSAASPDGRGWGLACSLTGTVGKIKDDATEVFRNYPDVRVLIFATPKPVTQYRKGEWQKEIHEKFGYDLIVISREDIVTDLLNPANALLCRTHLKLAVPVEEPETELLEKALLAAAAVTESWISHPRLAGKPIIPLQAVRLSEAGEEIDGILSEDDIYTALEEGRRVVLEAPAGRGKTTTLIELAKRDDNAKVITFLIDLPAWIRSQMPILEYIASSTQYRSRNVDAGALSKLGTIAHFLLLLNGWNEVSEPSEAARALIELDRDFPAAGLIVATRAHYISPPLPGSFRAKLLPLNRSQRAEYLKLSLGSQADELGSKLARDPVLDDLTRTPLFLAEVTTIFRSGGSIPTTKMGVLGAVMRLLEQSEEHRAGLQGPPLTGHTSDYLSELAHQMTSLGEVAISEEEARRTSHSVSAKLRDAGQIAALPEPASILDALCAHHILERFEYPRTEFRFEHQQFQEFYAASLLRHQLLGATRNNDQNGIQRFVRQYVNEPRWEETLLMIAQEIGMTSRESPGNLDLVRACKMLVEEALNVDPFFSAQLSRRCGPRAWDEVKGAVGARLRLWYGVADASHRHCALAAMLATGSDDFADIVIPLLSSDDVQTRLTAYRAAGEFHVSSLGSNWENLVRGWKEEARITFVVELIHNRSEIEAVVRIALADPNPRVRLAASEALSWVGSERDIERLFDTLDAEDFETAVQRLPLARIPPGMRDRAIAAWRKRLADSPDAINRLRIMLTLAAAGVTSTTEDWKKELARLEAGRMGGEIEPAIAASLDVVKKADPHWVSHWVAGRIVEGALWCERWIHLVTSIPDSLKENLLERISGKELQYREISDAVAVLATAADFSLVKHAFSELRDIRSGLSLDAAGDTSQWAIVRQLEDLLRAIPITIVVESLSDRLLKDPDGDDLIVMIELLSSVARGSSDLSGQLPEDLRQDLRRYLKAGIPLVLGQEDFLGKMKADLISALARVGESKDMADLRQLIWADIERVRQGWEAYARGERSSMTNGASTSYANWNVKAIAYLDRDKAEDVLAEVIQELEYERCAAGELLLLARNDDREKRVAYSKDYSSVWEMRSTKQLEGYHEERRQRFAYIIKSHLQVLLKERTSQDYKAINLRLKRLANVLATLDPLDSAQLVMDVLALPGSWDGWERVDALEALLFGGASLPPDPTFAILDPIIEEMRPRMYENAQNMDLITRCLCLLPFVDTPATGIKKLRDVLSVIRLPLHEMREVVTALGYSRCDEALALLRELACSDANDPRYLTREWIDAVGMISVPDSLELLMSFVDSGEDGLECDIDWNDHSADILAIRLAEKARADASIMQRILRLCTIRLLPAERLLLSKVIAQLETSDAILVGLNLIDDSLAPPVPYDLKTAIEAVFFERRPYGQAGAFTLNPRDSNQIRARLFGMVLGDDRRRQSAFALLGQIEAWRLEYGRPVTESRHPALDSGESWPPLKAVSH